MDAAVLISHQRPHDRFGLGYRGPAGCSHPPTRVPPSGDHRQAEYFVRLLTQSLSRIDQRIEKCRRAIAFSQAAGDIENVLGFRDLMSNEQEERRAVERLIANLLRRFDLPSSGRNR